MTSPDAGTGRYDRQMRVPGVGAEGQHRLRRARVLLIGAGGLGAPAALYLAGAGVGTLGIVDDDVVDLSNLHRQIVHTTAAVGEPKTESARRTLQALNPDVTVECLTTRLTAGNAVDLLRGWDMVLDGSDDFATRYLVSDAAAVLDIPHVWASVMASGGQLSVFDAARGPVYRDLFPVMPAPGSVPSCAQAGVLPVVPGVLGVAMAAEALKLVLGLGSPLVGRVAIYDMLTAEWDQVPVQAHPQVQRPSTAAEVGAGLPPTVTVEELADVLGQAGVLARAGASEDRGSLLSVLDVRTAAERVAGTVPGSVHVPVEEIEEDPLRVLDGLGGGAGAVYVFCASGARSARAAHALRRVGAEAVDVLGGYEAWERRIGDGRGPAEKQTGRQQTSEQETPGGGEWRHG